MPRDDKPYEPIVEFPYRILASIPTYWFYILSAVGGVTGTIYAHYHGYKPLRGLVIGAVVGFLFLPFLAKALELATAVVILAVIAAIIYYVFIKN